MTLLVCMHACTNSEPLNLSKSIVDFNFPATCGFLTLDRSGDRPNRYRCTLAHFSYVFIRMINTHHSQRNHPFHHGSSPTTSDSCVTSGRHTSQENSNRAFAPSICRHSIAVDFSVCDNVFQSKLLRQQRSTHDLSLSKTKNFERWISFISACTNSTGPIFIFSRPLHGEYSSAEIDRMQHLIKLACEYRWG